MVFDTIYTGSQVATHKETFFSDIGVKDGKIIQIGDLSEFTSKKNS
jgi:predicted amidohydrolase YtcJ